MCKIQMHDNHPSCILKIFRSSDHGRAPVSRITIKWVECKIAHAIFSQQQIYLHITNDTKIICQEHSIGAL